MNHPKISVVLPVKNGAEYLSSALNGIENLNFDSWEIVVIDDGSVDNTRELLLNWSATTSVACTVLTNTTSHGVALARNAAVAEASGEFIWFVDGDDSWSPDILAHLWGGVSTPEVDMVVCDARRVVSKTGHSSSICDAPRNETITGQEALRRVLRGELQGHLWNKIIRRARLQECPFPDLTAHSDLAGVVRLLLSTSRVVFVPGAKYSYDVRDGSIIQSAEYKWSNLVRCAEVAGEALMEKGLESQVADEFRFFTWSHVMIPAANNVLTSATPDISIIPYRDSITTSMLIASWRQNRRTMTLKAAALRWSPRLYGLIYRRYHAKKWGLAPLGEMS
ncbi:glycosyltransferase family A protein [Kocuria sp. CPCC 205231]|uniref:glycosyltransferase family 2 protein n=1 Tax=Kocuria sp. CPCC 205231 TaxID=3073551 RepID=UPI0034D66644